MTLARPPKDLESYLGRKWLESIVGAVNTLATSAGVTSIQKIANPALTGAVTLSEGSGVTITQVGQNITFAASFGTVDISSQTNLAVTSPIVLTGDTLSLGTIDISANTNLAVTSPIVLTGDTLSIDYNTTNLKITSSQLNTIQDIATASAPTFAGLTLSGDLTYSADVTVNIGSATRRPRLIHIGGSVGGAINTAFRGLNIIGAGADFYIGDDNVSPGYYAQRAVVSGSTVSDYSQDYSNLFQGDSAYQYLALNFGITRAIGSNGVVIGDNNTGEGCSLIIGTSTTRRMEMYLDYANKTFVMDGNVTSGIAANKCMKVKLELGATAPTFYPATDNKIDFGIASTNRWKDYYGMTATLSTSLTLSALTLGSIPFAGTAGLISQDNSNLFWDNTNKRLGIHTTTPTNSISLGGTAARKIWMERHTTANTAGNILTVQSGSATSAATNKAGGKLVLSSGISTGSQTGTVEVWTAAAGTAGTTDNTPSVKLAIAGSGAQVLTQTGGIAGITQNLTNTTTTSSQTTAGHFWNISHNNMVDSSLIGLQMQLSGTVNASDTGGSSMQGFAFEVYEAGTGVGCGATALGGFIRHSSNVAGLYFTGCNIDVQVGSGAGASDIVLYETGVSNIGANTTSWTAFHANDPLPSAGTVTTAYGLKIEAMTSATNSYAIHSAGGQSVHAGNLKLGDTTDPTEQLEFADSKNIKFHTTTGTKIGTGITEKMGFYNATPIVQRSGAAQVAVATTAATNVAPYGYTTAAQADAIITLLNELRNWCVAQGFIKGSA